MWLHMGVARIISNAVTCSEVKERLNLISVLLSKKLTVDSCIM